MTTPPVPRRWHALLVFLAVLPFAGILVVIAIVGSHRGTPLTSADLLNAFLVNVPLIAPFVVVWIATRRRQRRP